MSFNRFLVVNMSPGPVSFGREKDAREGSPLAINTLINVILVGSYAFTFDNCHGSNSSVLKNGLPWFCD